MLSFPKMPDCAEIRVGIITAGEPDITLCGEYDERREEGCRVLTPRTADCRGRLANLRIGRGFHWDRVTEASLPGRIEIHDTPSEHEISLINVLDIEDYLLRVVGSEMNPAAPMEFLKAHAVVSRSWALGKALHVHPEENEGKKETADLSVGWDDTASHTWFDVCSDDHCQRYQGDTHISPETAAAIRATRGLVLVDSDGRIADARFSKCCGGMTELFSNCWQDRDFDYLVSKADPWCDLSTMSYNDRDRLLSSILKDYDRETNDFHDWEERVETTLVPRRVREVTGRDIGRFVRAVPLKRGPSGRIVTILIEGTEGSMTVGKELRVRRLFSESHLKSSAFDIYPEGNTLILRGRGWGHGVGMCQIGAARMALTHTFEEILNFYYPNALLRKL